MNDKLNTTGFDLNTQWLDEMKKAYRTLYDKVNPCIRDAYEKGTLQRTTSISTVN